MEIGVIFKIIEFIKMKSTLNEHHIKYVSLDEIIDYFHGIDNSEMEFILSKLEAGIVTVVLEKNKLKKGWNIGWTEEYYDFCMNQAQKIFKEYNSTQFERMEN